MLQFSRVIVRRQCLFETLNGDLVIFSYKISEFPNSDPRGSTKQPAD